MPPRTVEEVSLTRKSSHLTQFSYWCHGINTWASSKRKSPLQCGVSLESSTVFTVALSDFNYGYVCSTLLSAGGVSSRTDRTIENVLDNFPKILYPPPIRVTMQLSVLQLPARTRVKSIEKFSENLSVALSRFRSQNCLTLCIVRHGGECGEDFITISIWVEHAEARISIPVRRPSL